MKKVKLSNDKCIGCGACTAIDPEHFDFDNENNVCKVISQENVENSASIQEAVESCPVGAISITEENESTKSNCECNNTNCGSSCNCNK